MTLFSSRHVSLPLPSKRNHSGSLEVLRHGYRVCFFKRGNEVMISINLVESLHEPRCSQEIGQSWLGRLSSEHRNLSSLQLKSPEPKTSIFGLQPQLSLTGRLGWSEISVWSTQLQATLSGNSYCSLGLSFFIWKRKVFCWNQLFSNCGQKSFADVSLHLQQDLSWDGKEKAHRSLCCPWVYPEHHGF